MRAELFVSLDVDAIGTIIEIKIVDIGRTHVDAEGVGDLAERDVQALGLFAVDGDDVLRIVRGVSAEESCQVFFRTLGGGTNEVVGGFVEILEGMSSLIEEFVLEAAELAETLDGRRLEGDHDGAGDSEERAAETVQDGSGGMLFTLTFTVRLERKKHETGVGSGAAEAEAGDREGASNFRDIFCNSRNLPADIAGVFERSSGWSLDGNDEVTLIFGRHEALRHVAECVVGEAEAEDEENERDGFKAEKRAKSVLVAIGYGVEHT